MGVTFGGPMFEGSDQKHCHSIHKKHGAHYNIYAFNSPEDATALLHQYFDNRPCCELNFVLFSTSGVHGSYLTLDDIAKGVVKHGDAPDFGDDDWPNDYHGDTVTVLLVQPRIVCMRYGNARVRASDVGFFKRIQAESWNAVVMIGAPEPAATNKDGPRI